MRKVRSIVEEKKIMGWYILWVRLASMFAGAAVASAAALYILHQDYKAAHKINGLRHSLDARISSLEKLKEVDATKQFSNSTTRRCQSSSSGSSIIIRCGIAEPSGQPAPFGQKTKYNDGFFEKAFMTLFAKKMEKFGGSSSKKDKKGGLFDYDYEGFVEVSKRVMQGRSRMQQQEVVREVLLSMLPPGAPAQFRKLFPPTKWAEEFNAALTVPFFHWLVGPSEVVEVEINGVTHRSSVHIMKCRYLENSGCVGMCVNMCKIPTQDFFTNEFGLPLTMIPNFEDMSCEMVYGQVPPPFEEDPVAKQPCFANICSVANPSASVCPKIAA